MGHVRVSAKAIVIRDGRLLVLRNRDENGDWYMLPGGGQEHGETLPVALARECLEEVGCTVTVGRVRFVRDYIARHHEFAYAEPEVHQVEVMFDCGLASEPCMGGKPDSMQTGIEWLELTTLARHRIYPSVLPELLSHGTSFDGALYLGDVN